MPRAYPARKNRFLLVNVGAPIQIRQDFLTRSPTLKGLRAPRRQSPWPDKCPDRYCASAPLRLKHETHLEYADKPPPASRPSANWN